MTGKANGTSVSRTARVVGVQYVLVFPLGFLDLHRPGIYIAQIFWGLWLLREVAA